MKTLLSKEMVDTIATPEKETDIWDTRVHGLILRLLTSGKKVYRCEYARGKRVTIGKAEDISLSNARMRAKQILSDALNGLDPRTKEPEIEAPNKKRNIPTLETFIEIEYATWRAANSKHSKSDIDRIKTNFFAQFGKMPLYEISAREVEQWRTQRIHSGIKHDTVNREVTLLKAALSKAVEWEIIAANPLQKLKPTKGPDSTRVRYLDKDEEKRLSDTITLRDAEAKEARDRYNQWRKERNYDLYVSLSQCAYSDHMTPMILISLNTGLRQGELFNLTWKQVDLNKKLVSILGKNNKWRHVPLNATAFSAFKQWQAQCNNKTLVFPGSAPEKPFDNVNKAWNTILKKAEIENFRWHDMRHHFASKLVMAGVDLNTVRELLGHADIKMTLRYAHLAPEHKAEAVSRIG